MQRVLSSTLILAALATTGVAQGEEPGNYYRGTATNWVTRYAGTDTVMLCRYADTMVSGIPPLIGGTVRVYDFVSATQDTFNLVIYEETAPGAHTLKTTPAVDVGPNPVVSGWVSVKLQSPPIYVIRPGIDVWIGGKMNQALNTSDNDGSWFYMLRGYSSTAANTEDMPGRRLPNTGVPPADSIWAGGSASAPAPGSDARGIYGEPVHNPQQGVGAYAVAKTNQTDQKGISGDQIIGGFNSGTHPDVTGHNTGRQDDFGFEVQGALAVNLPVVFFVAAKFGPPIPLSKGTFCLDLSTLIPLGAVVGDSLGMATLLFPNAVGQALISSLGQFDIHYGAVIVDTGNNNALYGTPCAAQQL